MSRLTLDKRHEEERAHGRLIQQDPESVWGQCTRAVRIRVERRSGLIIRRCGMGAGVRVLELGCGSGNYSAAFAATGAELTAIDPSDDLLAIARKRLPQVRFENAAAEHLTGIDDCSIDRVVGNAVLHHFDVPLALAALHRVLRPRGMICFAGATGS